MTTPTLLNQQEITALKGQKKIPGIITQAGPEVPSSVAAERAARMGKAITPVSRVSVVAPPRYKDEIPSSVAAERAARMRTTPNKGGSIKYTNQAGQQVTKEYAASPYNAPGTAQPAAPAAAAPTPVDEKLEFQQSVTEAPQPVTPAPAPATGAAPAGTPVALQTAPPARQPTPPPPPPAGTTAPEPAAKPEPTPAPAPAEATESGGMTGRDISTLAAGAAAVPGKQTMAGVMRAGRAAAALAPRVGGLLARSTPHGRALLGGYALGNLIGLDKVGERIGYAMAGPSEADFRRPSSEAVPRGPAQKFFGASRRIQPDTSRFRHP